MVRPIDRKRWRQRLTAHLEDFPRQLDALRYSTQSFEPDFDRAAFASAFASADPEPYLTRRLVRMQRSRGLFEHDCVRVSAADVHEVVLLLLDAAPAFLKAILPFVEPLLVPRR